jgi:predicted enzyme related to lactoylglutathione lyase
MLLGLRTAIYQVSDLKQAKRWYADVLGVEPYFDEPFYVGFNVGGFELGLQQDKPSSVAVENVVAYWGVADIETEYERLLKLGATAHNPVADVGGGIKVAVVRDPFGNAFGLIFNPHFNLPAK